ncbi:MAG: M23 family metallopeptidase [Longimicrobiales bacterium]|nr:M23 family metallopeptidase [Longimicrobiales bacterium]
MAGDRWTLLVLDDRAGETRQFSVSRRRVRSVATAVAGLLLLLGGSAVWLVREGSARVEAALLERENGVLVAELARLQDRVVAVEGSMARIAERNAFVRNLAGLDPIDDEVLQVGIGGPGGLTPQASPLWEVDPALGSRSFALAYDLSALERRADLLTRSFDAAGDSLQAHHDLLRSTPSILPTSGWLSSRFARARQHPIHNEALPHRGVDISADKGTPILSAARGRVVRAGWATGLGQMVEIDHGYGYVTRYGHASKLHVRVGQSVERGQLIAQVGSTGIATGPHLHYEVWQHGVARNPLDFVFPAEIP